MSANTKIEWATHTANLWWGCVEVSPACDNCYAREWAKRYDRAKWGADEPRLTIKGVWNDLKKFQRDAAAGNRIDRVFVGSMMDIFEKPMPVVDSKGERVGGVTTDHLRQGFFEEVVPACPNLLFLLLTKRPGNIPKYIPESWRGGAPDNVMFGTSVGDQEQADRAIPELLKAPGRRFLSIEPLIAPVSLLDINGALASWRRVGAIDAVNEGGIHWVIVGGESGHKSRPMHPNWARGLRDECVDAGVPFLFKQWGHFEPVDESDGVLVSSNKNAVTLFANGQTSFTDEQKARVNVARNHGAGRCALMFPVGKKAAGRMLDGRTWDELPAVAQLAT